MRAQVSEKHAGESRVARVRMIGASLAAMLVGVLLTCMVGPAQSSKRTATYYRDVLPILRRHCEVCHRTGGIAPMSFETHSVKNPHNPDPRAAVRWGEQTYEEMMIGFFDVAVAANLDKHGYFLRH